MANAFRTQLLDMVEFTDYAAWFADPARQLMEVEPWSYSIDGDVLPASITATAPQSFNTPMAGDADFLMTYISGFARPAGTTQLTVNPALLVQIADQSSGRTFFSGPAGMAFIAGQGGFPYLLTSPRIVKARAALKTTAISAQAQSFTGFYMTFHGVRLWYGS